MKIAVTYENGQVFQHFGHTEFFKIYEIKDGKMTGTVVPVTGGGHGALAGFLEAQGVDTLICGGIGMGAQVALDNADIALYAGITGSADEAVAKLLAGVLPVFLIVYTVVYALCMLSMKADEKRINQALKDR